MSSIWVNCVLCPRSSVLIFSVAWPSRASATEPFE